MVRVLLRLVAAAFLLLLLATPVLAQSRLVITDPDSRLDRAALERAAAPLLRRDAEVAIYLLDEGGAADFQTRLTRDGFVSGGLRRTKMIAIYVALDSRFSAIQYGDGWNAALDVPVGDTKNYDLIRTQSLNPGLSSGDYTSAFTTALGAIEAAIVSPPSPNGSINVDTVPLAAGGLTLAAAVAGGVVVVNRRRAAKTRAEAERQHKEAREGVAVLITGMGQRFRNADEKARYDAVSYAPADVERLKRAQAAAQARFAQVQTQFDDIGEQLERYAKPELAQINATTAAYDQVRALAEAVAQDLSAVEQMRLELDALARQAPEEIARVKKS
ncbi:hypothetical protein [Candidatus Oscillochloris fontis]|uniref:hypothetical protein n=1 Tax=Candidatus Oscillochloris fontis TaxID=2496868 RepID=UPI00101D6D98|nr:hypothetical protein [Candidatus Oscillochloris fontis]